MILANDWVTGRINIAVDDDLTYAIDLGEREWDSVLVKIPTLTSSNLTVYVSKTFDGTYSALGNSATVVAGTGNYMDEWELCGHRYLKIGTSASQAADRVFELRGKRS